MGSSPPSSAKEKQVISPDCEFKMQREKLKLDFEVVNYEPDRLLQFEGGVSCLVGVEQKIYIFGTSIMGQLISKQEITSVTQFKDLKEIKQVVVLKPDLILMFSSSKICLADGDLIMDSLGHMIKDDAWSVVVNRNKVFYLTCKGFLYNLDVDLMVSRKKLEPAFVQDQVSGFCFVELATLVTVGFLGEIAFNGIEEKTLKSQLKNEEVEFMAMLTVDDYVILSAKCGESPETDHYYLLDSKMNLLSKVVKGRRNGAHTAVSKLSSGRLGTGQVLIFALAGVREIDVLTLREERLSFVRSIHLDESECFRSFVHMSRDTWLIGGYQHFEGDKIPNLKRLRVSSPN